MDGLSGESLKPADPILAVLLSICFTCMFKHCYLPSNMLDSFIVPLVKNKNGGLSDKNNYRIRIRKIRIRLFRNRYLIQSLIQYRLASLSINPASRASACTDCEYIGCTIAMIIIVILVRSLLLVY